ncbi:toll-like receptor 4 [Dreissena polymorpha]|uniref:toll-like receptor 4 n=1 Tax=Dreissena polymorpha TaxID=45954 RepID=UPI002263F9D7|nr:toll-like receptor 4 [Dreissena polymorpha]
MFKCILITFLVNQITLIKTEWLPNRNPAKLSDGAAYIGSRRSSGMKWTVVEKSLQVLGPTSPVVCNTCNCTKDHKEYLYVDCSYLSLENAFQTVSQNTFWLDYSYNYISEVKYGNFRGLNILQYLNLQYNSIECLDSDTFEDLTDLMELHLDHNHMFVLQIHIPIGTFDSLKNLRVLTVHANVQKNSDSKLIGRTFRNLINLNFLAIDGFRKIKFDENFLNTNVSTLVLAGKPPWGCDIDVIEDDTFSGLPKLQTLSLRKCNLSSLSPVALSQLKSLENLDISSNIRLGMTQLLGPIAKALINSTVKILNINEITDPFESVNKLDNNNLLYINQVNLTELYMDSNCIDLIDYHNPLFSKSYTLKVLSLRQNMLFNAFFLDKLILTNPSIEELDCGNQFQVWNENRVAAERARRETNAAFNLSVISMKTFIFTGLKSSLSISVFGDTQNVLEYIDISSNQIQILDDDDLHSLFNLTFLNVSDNLIENVSLTAFRDTISLKYLDMKYNRLGYALGTEEAMDIFLPLKNLETLNISKNMIYNLKESLLTQCASMRVIDISKNYLDNFDLNLHNLRNLTFLNLKNNRIQTLSYTVRSYLSNIVSNHELVVDLENNKLTCDCDNIEFLKWLLTTKCFFHRKTIL